MRILDYFFLFFFLTMSLHAGAQLTNGMLVHYAFDNNYVDATPNGFDATPSGTVFVEDRFGNANSSAFFNGLDTYVELPNDNILRPDFPFSVSLWFNATRLENGLTGGFGMFNSCFVEDSYHGAFISIPDGGLKSMIISYGDGTGCAGSGCRRSEYATSTSLTEDTWYHVAALYNSPTDLQLYINGCRLPTEASGTGDLAIGYTNSPGNIGRIDGSSSPGVPIGHFHGAIDDFYMWDRTLTIDEINELYDFQSGSFINFTARADSVSCNVEEVPLIIEADDIYNYTLNGSPISLNNLPSLPGGSYTIEASNGSCMATQILEVPFDTIVPELEVNIGNITCDNPAAKLSASLHPDILSYNWWSVNGSLIAQGEDATIDQVGNYFLIAVADNGCTETYEFEIIEDLEEPTFSVSATEITCADPALVSATQENPDYVIEWTQFGLFIADTFSFTTEQAGVYLATVTDTMNGCSTTMDITVNGNVIPITGIDFELVQDCEDIQALYNFNAVIGGVGPYTINSTAVEFQGEEYFSLGPNNIQVVDSQGCIYDTSFTIDNINNTLSIDYELANDCDLLLTLLETAYVSGAMNPLTLMHSGEEIDGNVYFAAGNHWIEAVDELGCRAREEFTVETLTEVGFLEFVYQESCGEDFIIIDSVFDTVNQNTPWLLATSGDITTNGIIFTEGNHFMQVASTIDGCPKDTNFVVEPFTNIDDVIFTVNQECATGQAELFIDEIIGGSAPFTVDAMSGILVGDSYLFDTGQHMIQITDVNGCSFEFDIDVSPATAISLEDIPDMEIEWPEEVQLEIKTNRTEDQIQSIQWTGYDMLSCTDCFLTTLSPDQNVTILYSVEDIFGCTIEQEVEIRVDKNIAIYAPNVFSPNNDGNNDVFTIFPKRDIVATIIEYSIYDRWGNLVHDPVNNADLDTYAGWDGKMNGKDVATGVYVYYYEAELVNGEITKKSGSVTLLR